MLTPIHTIYSKLVERFKEMEIFLLLLRHKKIDARKIKKKIEKGTEKTTKNQFTGEKWLKKDSSSLSLIIIINNRRLKMKCVCFNIADLLSSLFLVFSSFGWHHRQTKCRLTRHLQNCSSPYTPIFASFSTFSTTPYEFVVPYKPK